MKLEKIELENFRGWNGLHEIKFSADPTKPVTLIIAENGTGKSNILEAIMWCLHDKLPESSNDRDQILNKHAIKKNPRTAASVKLTLIDDKISNFSKNKNPRYLISKELRPSSNNPISKQIWELDQNRQQPREHHGKTKLIESLLPERLSKFFLFSGEGIEQLFNHTEESLLIKAVEDIQGLTFANKALEDLGPYRDELIAELGKAQAADEKSKKASTAIEEENEIKEEHKEKKKELEKTKTKLEAGLREISKKIEKSDFEVAKETEKRLQAHTGQKNELMADKAIAEREILQLMSKAPYVLLFHEQKELKQFLSENKLRGIIPAPHDEKFVQKIIDDKVCICGREFCEGSNEENLIKTLLDESGSEVQHNNLTSAEGFINSFTFENKEFRDMFQSKEEKIHEKSQKLTTVLAEIDKCNGILKDIKNKDITDLLAEREEIYNELFPLSALIEAEQLKINKCDEFIKQKRKDILDGTGPIDKELQKKIHFISSCVKNLESIIQDTQEDGRERLLEKLNELADKYDTKVQKFVYSNDKSYKPMMVSRKEEMHLPENQGNAVIKSIFYAIALIDICKERFNNEEIIIQPGTIAPMICDAVFSALSVANTEAVTRLLCSVPEQTVLMINAVSFSQCQNVLAELDVVGETYLFQRLQPEINESKSKIEINGKKFDAFVKDKNITTNSLRKLRI